MARLTEAEYLEQMFKGLTPNDVSDDDVRQVLDLYQNDYLASFEPEKSQTENIVAGIGERIGDLVGNVGGFVDDAALELAEMTEGTWIEDLSHFRVGYNLDNKDSGWDAGVYSTDEIKKQGRVGKAVEEIMTNANFDYEAKYTVDRLLDSEGFADAAWNTAGLMVEQGLVSAPDMAGIIYAPGTYLVSRSQELSNERAKNNGRDEPTKEDRAWGSATAVASIVLDKYSSNILMGKGKDKFDGVLKAIGKKVGIETTTEAIQEAGEYAGVTVGTEEGFELKDAGKAALGGGLGGMGISAPIATINSIAQKRKQLKDIQDETGNTDSRLEQLKAEAEAKMAKAKQANEEVLSGKKETSTKVEETLQPMTKPSGKITSAQGGQHVDEVDPSLLKPAPVQEPKVENLPPEPNKDPFDITKPEPMPNIIMDQVREANQQAIDEPVTPQPEPKPLSKKKEEEVAPAVTIEPIIPESQKKTEAIKLQRKKQSVASAEEAVVDAQLVEAKAQTPHAKKQAAVQVEKAKEKVAVAEEQVTVEELKQQEQKEKLVKEQLIKTNEEHLANNNLKTGSSVRIGRGKKVFTLVTAYPGTGVAYLEDDKGVVKSYPITKVNALPDDSKTTFNPKKKLTKADQKIADDTQLIQDAAMGKLSTTSTISEEEHLKTQQEVLEAQQAIREEKKLQQAQNIKEDVTGNILINDKAVWSHDQQAIVDPITEEPITIGRKTAESFFNSNTDTISEEQKIDYLGTTYPKSDWAKLRNQDVEYQSAKITRAKSQYNKLLGQLEGENKQGVTKEQVEKAQKKWEDLVAKDAIEKARLEKIGKQVTKTETTKAEGTTKAEVEGMSEAAAGQQEVEVGTDVDVTDVDEDIETPETEVKVDQKKAKELEEAIYQEDKANLKDAFNATKKTIQESPLLEEDKKEQLSNLNEKYIKDLYELEKAHGKNKPKTTEKAPKSKPKASKPTTPKEDKAKKEKDWRFDSMEELDNAFSTGFGFQKAIVLAQQGKLLPPKLNKKFME